MSIDKACETTFEEEQLRGEESHKLDVHDELLVQFLSLEAKSIVCP
jgi:hypothetical protein